MEIKDARSIRVLLYYLTLTTAVMLCITGETMSAPSGRSTEQTSDHSLDNAERARIIDVVLEAFEQHYISTDVAAAMAGHVRDKLNAGAYDKVTHRGLFAEQLTGDLRGISRDLHIRISEMTPTDADAAEGESLTPEMIAERARRNFDFRKAERLPGNIGYLNLTQFHSPSYAGETATAAMNFLANCDAVIIDLRNNGGGEDEMVQYLCSYFFKEPTHLHTFHNRSEGTINQVWTYAHVPGKTLYDTDLYLLTSERSASGAEAFAYALKNNNRATIIGKTTRGMANPVNFFDLPEIGVRAKIPIGRPESPVTGTNWEGTGVTPHQDVPVDSALDVAQMMALRKLSEKIKDPSARFQIDWALTEHEARSNPVTLDQNTLQGYAGEYGSIKLVFHEGALYYQRDTGERYETIPITETLLTCEEFRDMRLQMILDEGGRAFAIRLLFDDGYVIDKPRTGQ
jgi:retinol-binding protein 3